MLRRVLAAAVLAASSIAGAASAAEVMVASIMPGTTIWYVDDTRLLSVPSGQHGYKTFEAGSRKVTVMDLDGRTATRTLVFDPAQTARSGARQFWCLAARRKGADPELLQLDRATCQQFLDNQPPK